MRDFAGFNEEVVDGLNPSDCDRQSDRRRSGCPCPDRTAGQTGYQDNVHTGVDVKGPVFGCHWRRFGSPVPMGCRESATPVVLASASTSPFGVESGPFTQPGVPAWRWQVDRSSMSGESCSLSGSRLRNRCASTILPACRRTGIGRPS